MGEIVHLPKHRPEMRLTATESCVMELVVNEGMSNSEISKELGISEGTVRRHLFMVFNKTGHSTRLELAIRTLQKRSAQEKPDRMDEGFYKVLQESLKHLSRQQRDWMLDVVKLYSQRLHDGKIQPASVKPGVV
jgi:DNA-binding CsgD family transcriptional regulator